MLENNFNENFFAFQKMWKKGKTWQMATLYKYLKDILKKFWQLAFKLIICFKHFFIQIKFCINQGIIHSIFLSLIRKHRLMFKVANLIYDLVLDIVYNRKDLGCFNYKSKQYWIDG